MAINRESNAYTIIFAVIMVAVVGGLLAFLATSLAPTIKGNVRNEKMQNILQAMSSDEIRDLKRDDAGGQFYGYVKRRITLDYAGNIVSDKTGEEEIDPNDKLDAFNIDIRKEYKNFVKPILSANKGNKEAIATALAGSSDIHYPMFICEYKNETIFVIPCSGKGLWDDIWGYIGVKADGKTVCGAVFDHKGETPGLGSKIADDAFELQFIGGESGNDAPKLIADEVGYKPIDVVKPGSKELNEYRVDGISGATFTGVGVKEMLARSMAVYVNFFNNVSEGQQLIKG